MSGHVRVMVEVVTHKHGLTDFRVLLDGEQVGLGSRDEDGAVGGSGPWVESGDVEWQAVYAIVEALAEILAEDRESERDVFFSDLDERSRLEAYVYVDPEQCPGCGAKPGDGVKRWCSHPLGCGHWKAEAP